MSPVNKTGAKPETMSVEQATKNISVNQVLQKSVKDISKNLKSMISEAVKPKGSNS